MTKIAAYLERSLEQLKIQFEENFTVYNEVGAAVSVWQKEKEVCILQGGWKDREKTAEFTVDTPVCFFSATKGLASSCLLHALASDGISLETPVSKYWPEFAQAGKESITIAQLLSHQAGLCALEKENASISIFDHSRVATALAAQAPLWSIGTGHGYHPRTFGILVDALLRRLRPGYTLGHYWRETFAQPLALDIWIGLPAELDSQVAPIYPVRVSSNTTTSNSKESIPVEQKTFYTALATKGTLSNQAFTTPADLVSVSRMNTPQTRQAELPSLGGIGSARGLAKFYAMLANGGQWEGKTLMPSLAIEWMTTPLVNDSDKIFLLDTAFSAGFMQDPFKATGSTVQKKRQLFGSSLRAFGHPGAGGSHGFADPENGLSFAYVMNQMEMGIFPTNKTLGLVTALYGNQT